MATNESAADIRHVVHIATNVSTGCEHCVHSIGGERFAESVHHYVEAHGYRLLHIGQETENGPEGAWHSTVAVLGTTLRADELPTRPRVKVTMG